MGNANDWEPIAQELATDFFCIAVNLPGHGGTPIDPDESFATLAADVIEVVDDLGADTFSILGYSMGGRIALYLALQYAMRIDALILESASPGLRTQAERSQRQTWDDEQATRIESTPLDEYARTWYAQPLFASLANHPDLRDTLIANRRNNDPAALATAIRQLGTGRQLPLWDELPEHRIPTLLIAGALDEKYTQLAHAMAESCPVAQTTIIESAGHNTHAESPTPFINAITQFLQDTINS